MMALLSAFPHALSSFLSQIFAVKLCDNTEKIDEHPASWGRGVNILCIRYQFLLFGVNFLHQAVQIPDVPREPVQFMHQDNIEHVVIKVA
jgi:hypothetical protein